MIKIHNFARGARGVRVAWLCEEMGLEYQVHAHGYPTPPEYREKHPLGRVPFLEDGGVGMSESAAMLLYLATRHGPTDLLPGKDDPALAAVLEYTVMAESNLGAEINVLLAEAFGAPAEHKGNWSANGVRARVAEVVGYVGARLGDGPWLAGDRFTIADIAMVTTLGMWRGALGGALPKSLSGLMDRAQARPGYQAAAAKFAG